MERQKLFPGNLQKEQALNKSEVFLSKYAQEAKKENVQSKEYMLITAVSGDRKSKRCLVPM